jgi:hypothetical protein
MQKLPVNNAAKFPLKPRFKAMAFSLLNAVQSTVQRGVFTQFLSIPFSTQIPRKSKTGHDQFSTSFHKLHLMKKLIFRFLLLLFFSMTWGSSFGQDDKRGIVEEPLRHFTINEETGAITELDCLQLKPRMVSDRQLRIEHERNRKYDKIWRDQTLNRVMHSKKIKQVGEYIDPARSPNGKYFICTDYDHGGIGNFIHFFDNKDSLISSYKFPDEQEFEKGFNSDGNCVILTSSNADEFIFLNSEGKAIYKGSYNQIAGKTNGTLWTNVSSKGNYWIAFGQEGVYVGDRNGAIIHHATVENQITQGAFTENEKYLILVSSDQILVFDLFQKKVVAVSNHLVQRPILYNMSIIISDKNNPKTLFYDFE